MDSRGEAQPGEWEWTRPTSRPGLAAAGEPGRYEALSSVTSEHHGSWVVGSVVSFGPVVTPPTVPGRGSRGDTTADPGRRQGPPS
ncbi:hypothetical protein [Actinomycetospora chibensis]|uniref:Uncharacterized protein n=1 Tax=Actinomycetospora chibensis TaxID=663606 RepID=A0ABV9RFU9_9PSEU|nr:hypothetical protein [Actinomycetospora chibensis]MDD7927851.1 hypothetical protein [Actinomycetospora chibensis]